VGVRKIRWATAGRGKRGGIRAICHLRSRQRQIWMLTVCSKTEAATHPAHVLKKIKEDIDGQS
jgi:hypothetical protein